MEGKKERLIQELIRRRIPAYMWNHFPEGSEHWDLESIAKGDLWEELKKFSK